MSAAAKGEFQALRKRYDTLLPKGQVGVVEEELLDVGLKMVASNLNATKRVLADVLKFRWPEETTVLQGIQKTLYMTITTFQDP